MTGCESFLLQANTVRRKKRIKRLGDANRQNVISNALIS
jgi:hypothetical protein